MYENLLKDLAENQKLEIKTSAEKNYVELRVSIIITSEKGIFKVLHKYSADVYINDEGNLMIENIDNYDTVCYLYGLQVNMSDVKQSLANFGVMNVKELLKIPEISVEELKKHISELDEVKKLITK